MKKVLKALGITLGSAIIAGSVQRLVEWYEEYQDDMDELEIWRENALAEVENESEKEDC